MKLPTCIFGRYARNRVASLRPASNVLCWPSWDTRSSAWSRGSEPVFLLERLFRSFKDSSMSVEQSSARKDILRIPRHNQDLRRLSSTARRLCARQPVLCVAMLPMEYINPIFRVQLMALRLKEQRVDTYHSVRLVRVMAFDVEHITCGTFSPGVGTSTSACIDCGVHASCDAVYSTSCHLSASTSGDVQLCRFQ